VLLPRELDVLTGCKYESLRASLGAMNTSELATR
jgi:hypothetical protein